MVEAVARSSVVLSGRELGLAVDSAVRAVAEVADQAASLANQAAEVVDRVVSLADQAVKADQVVRQADRKGLVQAVEVDRVYSTALEEHTAHTVVCWADRTARHGLHLLQLGWMHMESSKYQAFVAQPEQAVEVHWAR